MLPFAKLSTVPEKKFVRTVGSHKEDFLSLHSKVTDYSEAEKKQQPFEKTGKKSTLSSEDKLLLTLYYLRHYPTFDVLGNRELTKQRISIEHVNRRCKIFRIVKETYRSKHKNYSLNWHVVAALVNLRYGVI
jgi:hypothetical protein